MGKKTWPTSWQSARWSVQQTINALKEDRGGWCPQSKTIFKVFMIWL